MPEGMKLAEKPPDTPAKAARDAGEWVAPGSVENDAAQGNDENVTGVGSRVADDCGENQHRGQKLLGGEAEHPLESSVDETGVFGDADAQQRHQHDTERMETGEGGDHARHERRQRVARQLVDHPDRFAVPGVDLLELDRRQNRRHDPRGDHQDQEQHRRVRQLVAGYLDPVEGAVEKALLALSWRRGRGLFGLFGLFSHRSPPPFG